MAKMFNTLIIGVFKQPVSLMNAWKARGVDTLFYWEEEKNGAGVPTMPQQKWRDEAKARGLKYIDQPLQGSGTNLLPAEIADTSLIAVGQPDESDRQKIPNDTFIARYNAMKASGKPVYSNFDGHQFDVVDYDGRKHRTDKNIDRPFWHRAADQGYFAGCDFGGDDYYLKPERWGMWNITERLMDRWQEWSGNKPYVIVLPTSANDKGYSWADVRLTLLHDVSYCARIGLPLAGICLFPQQVPPKKFRYDDSSAETAARMADLFGELKGIAPKLVDPAPLPQPLPEPQPDPQVEQLRKELDQANEKVQTLTGTIDAGKKFFADLMK